MVHAAAAHPGYVLKAGADPHPGPREAFARDHNARAYADVTELVARPGGAGRLHRHPAPVSRPARNACRRARQAHHPGKADGADARRLRRDHRRGRTSQGASRRRPHPRLRSERAADARHHRPRRAGPARADQQLQLHEFSLPPAPARGARHREGRRHPVQPGAAPDRHRAAARRRRGDERAGAGKRARSVAADRGKLRGACCSSTDGAAASLVYSGYDHFDTDEWHFGIGERGAPKPIAHGAARRALASAKDETKARTETFAYGNAAGELPPHQPHFGITIVTCANGDMRASADGVTIYGRDGVREIPLPRGGSMPGRREVLDDLAAAIRTGRSRSMTAAGARPPSRLRSRSCARRGRAGRSCWNIR